MKNLKFAFRTLFKTPFVTTVAILSLALGIGANAAIFSLSTRCCSAAAGARPGAAGEPRGAGSEAGSQSCSQAGDCDDVFSYPMFRDLEKVQTRVHRHRRARLVRRQPLIRRGRRSTATGCSSPAATSPCSADARARPAARPATTTARRRVAVVVLSYAYWKTRFGADPGVLNQTIIVNGQPDDRRRRAARIRGHDARAEAAGLRADHDAREMLPCFKAFDNRQSYWIYLFARLKPGRLASSRRARRSTGSTTPSSTTSRRRCRRA